MANEMIALTLPQEYPYVVSMACLISFNCLMVGFGAGARRRTIFNPEFMSKHFEKDHTKYVKQPLPKQGYPDCGNGVYSDKLDYGDWYKFNLD